MPFSPDEFLARPITGIQPFNELPVDAEIWREAHEHHHQHRRLHAAIAHRAGILFGLEVLAWPGQVGGVIVAPGVGIDAAGQTVVLSKPIRFVLEERSQIHLILSFLRTEDENSVIRVRGGKQPYRLEEGRAVGPVATRDLPRTAFLELARIERSSATAPVRDAANPFDPAIDELNLLHRPLAFPHCYVDAAVGELPYVPRQAPPRAWKPNRAGLVNLLREASGRGFHLDFLGPVNLRAAEALRAPVLLYVAGDDGFQRLAQEEIDGLGTFLAEGGMIWAEATGDEGFEAAFGELAGALGANLAPLPPGHPLLTAHHVFAAPPPGAREPGGLWGDDAAGVFFNTLDYGRLWHGNITPSADGRERIRAAQEWGMNIIAFAARRRRLRELSRLL
jgi:hypothetical protein